MAFLGSLDIVGSALSAERTRMDVTLQNISNAHMYPDGSLFRPLRQGRRIVSGQGNPRPLPGLAIFQVF